MSDIRMNNLPVLISYPRSGSNWFNAVMELYFNRPRLRRGPSSFLPDGNNRKDYMWFHDHDIFSKLKLNHNNIAYLYRNPSDVIYSLLVAEKKHINKNSINIQINLLSKHYKKYLLTNTPKTIIRYEYLKGKNYLKEFYKFIRFFGYKTINEQKLNNHLKIVTKSNLIEKNKNNDYFTKKLESEKYSNNRIIFKNEFENYINKELITDELLKFFTST